MSDITLRWSPDDIGSSDASLPSLFTALQEQLGLKLEYNKNPLDVIVIDHIEKPLCDQPLQLPKGLLLENHPYLFFFPWCALTQNQLAHLFEQRFRRVLQI